MSKPTLVLVHGAYHCPKHLEPLQTNLEGHGYKCVPVSLPSTQSTDLPPATLADDTVAVRNAVISELDRGNNVVVVAHSYGGVPANNALKGLDAASRQAAGATTSVTALAFLCSMPQPAGVVLATLQDDEKGCHDRRDSKHFCWVKENPGPAFYFYNDLPKAEAKAWCDLLRPMSWLALESATDYAAYLDVPSSYLFSTRDNTLPLPAQEYMVQTAIAAGARMTTESVDAGHSPFLSKIEETSAFIRRAAGRGDV